MCFIYFSTKKKIFALKLRRPKMPAPTATLTPNSLTFTNAANVSGTVIPLSGESIEFNKPIVGKQSFETNILTVPDGSAVSASSNFSAMEVRGSTSGAITIQSNATTATNTLNMPAAQALTSGDFLKNDGQGNLSWENAGAAPAAPNDGTGFLWIAEMDQDPTAETKLIPVDTESGHQFGNSVSLSPSGNVLIVGAQLDDGLNNALANSGAAYVYRWNGSSWGNWDGKKWDSEQKLLPSDPEANANYGSSVCASDNRVAIGAIWDDGPNNAYNNGAVYVYEWNGSAWSNETKLYADDHTTSGTAYNLGTSVFIENNLTIGTPGLFAGAPGAPGVYTWKWTGSGWGDQIKLVPGLPHVSYITILRSAFFGQSLSVSNNKLVIGAPLLNLSYAGVAGAANATPGAAFLYTWNGSSWSDYSLIIHPTGASYNHSADFGCDVSLSGNVLAVGAQKENFVGFTQAGAVYVYRWNGSAFAFEATLSAPTRTNYGGFGCSVQVSGNVIAIGERTGASYGNAYVYRYNGTSWVFGEKLSPTGDKDGTNGLYGEKVSVANNQLVVGAKGERSAGVYSVTGFAYSYQYNGTSWGNKFSSMGRKATLEGGYTNGAFYTINPVNNANSLLGVNLNVAGRIGFDVTGFDFTRDFYMQIDYRFYGGSVYFGFGGSSAFSSNHTTANNGVAFSMGERCQWYKNGQSLVPTGGLNHITNGFYNQESLQPSWFRLDTIEVRQVGNKRMANFFMGNMNALQLSADLTSWTPGGTHIFFATTSGTFPYTIVRGIILNYL